MLLQKGEQDKVDENCMVAESVCSNVYMVKVDLI